MRAKLGCNAYQAAEFECRSGQKVTLAERWNGRTWRLQITPNAIVYKWDLKKN
jgi:hypothetical protein